VKPATGYPSGSEIQSERVEYTPWSLASCAAVREDLVDHGRLRDVRDETGRPTE
jgi:hypothetical protein